METEEYRRMYELESSFWFYVTLHSLVLETFRTHKTPGPIRILDAGCGTGRLLQVLAAQGSVFGFDISTDALMYTKERGMKNLSRANTCELPYRSSSFDVLTSIDVLYHKRIKSDEAALKEFYRVLKKGGILILSVAALEIMKGNHDKVVHTRKRYNCRELTQKLEKCGFDILQKSYRLFFLALPILLIRLGDKLCKTEKKHMSDLKPLPPTLNALLIKLQLFENQLLNHISLPFGSSLFFVLKKK